MRDEVTRVAVPSSSGAATAPVVVVIRSVDAAAAAPMGDVVIRYADDEGDRRALALAYVAEQRQARREALRQQLERQRSHARGPR